MDKLAKEIAGILITCFNSGGKVLVCGNGGSAAEASHFVAELLGHFEKDRKPLPALSLNDISTITAIANDDGYENIFSRQIKALGNKGDVLITISTSGRSQNIIYAVHESKAKGMVHVAFPVNSETKKSTAETQQQHLSLIHKICRIIDNHYA